jgi:outer membrane murein-binding lipoprotein Lpp
MLNRENRMHSNNNYVVSDTEEEESKSENWDFAGAEDLDPIMDSYLLADTSHTQTPPPGVGGGILIVGGDSTEIHSEDLSLPGTESLPTDVGSLNDTAQFDSEFLGPKNVRANKRIKWAMATIGLLIVTLVSTIGGCVCLWRDRHGLDQHNQGLQLQVRELEAQLESLHQDMKAAKQQQERRQREAWNTRTDSDWEDEDFLAANKVLLADNCWFKAELELGDCLNEATDKFSEFSADATKTFQKYFWNENDNEDAAAVFQASAWKAASEATNAVASAAVNVMESMVSMGKVLDDSVLYAIEQTRDAVEDATLSKHL